MLIVLKCEPRGCTVSTDASQQEGQRFMSHIENDFSLRDLHVFPRALAFSQDIPQPKNMQFGKMG